MALARVHVVGEYCTGHGCWPSRRSIEGSRDVTAEGRGVHRLGDDWETHCCMMFCHDGVASSSSQTVFVNGRGVTRVGDDVSCGSKIMTGCRGVFCG